MAGGEIHWSERRNANGLQRVLGEELHGSSCCGFWRSCWNVKGLEIGGRGPHTADEFSPTRFNAAEQDSIITPRVGLVFGHGTLRQFAEKGQGKRLVLASLEHHEYRHA